MQHNRCFGEMSLALTTPLCNHSSGRPGKWSCIFYAPSPPGLCFINHIIVGVATLGIPSQHCSTTLSVSVGTPCTARQVPQAAGADEASDGGCDESLDMADLLSHVRIPHKVEGHHSHGQVEPGKCQAENCCEARLQGVSRHGQR